MRNAYKVMYHALIKTHHISSKKKIRSLRAACAEENVGVLIHVGVPGIMYVQGVQQAAVQRWVDHVHGLRYKDYHLAVRVEELDSKAQAQLGKKHSSATEETRLPEGQLDAVESVKVFGEKMQEVGVWDWWREGMGYKAT
ncbi:hypothetical protein CYLTODRAFT_352000 [Cylindrobasidium torrendii FP15055 ss-10]|uniref:Uncharacterized protein n=1 Tax=Cylindrobasidium torrendii FP15055 ss-10 TaxID=1314674 RepID=A0A0D7BBZ4_9AGAR|nr:hypothetical protein CYLTODRAFT_352000 [Cylindrobasidium torrendii FP15055 ss-10]